MEKNEIKKVKRIVDEAVKLQRMGKYDKGLDLLNQAEKEAEHLSTKDGKLILRLIKHYQGRILQAMGRHGDANFLLERAVEIAKEIGDPAGLGYSQFQLYINMIYGGIPVSPEEVEKTKNALWHWFDATGKVGEIGDIFQNLGFIEQTQGDINKAIFCYLVAEKFRKIANDQRGLALTWARLAECYKKIGQNKKAKIFGQKALKYFEEVGDVERILQIKKNVFGGERR